MGCKYFIWLWYNGAVKEQNRTGEPAKGKRGEEKAFVSPSPRLPFSGSVLLVLILVAVILLGGCATPVGVRQLDPRQVQLNLTTSILSGNELSASTRQILNRANLSGRFEGHPAEVLAELHKGLPTATDADRLFALAELSYDYASNGGPNEYFLTSAIYAYAFLFPKDKGFDPDKTDPRVRIALDLYNRSLAEAITTVDRSRVSIKEDTRKLSFGELKVTINPDDFQWGPFRLVNFVQAAELDVRGLRNRYRRPGIGAPLAAALKPIKDVEIPAFSKVPSSLKVPVTAFLRFDNVHEGLKNGTLTAKLELFTTEKATKVDIDGRTIPLEYELSSALAYTLEGSRVYDFELRGLFSGDFSLFKDKARYKDGIFLLTPYQPGLIPVIFVHGTASSPARWAEMLNEIQNDPDLWGRYQFWVFTYNTGNPIAYSAGILTEGLRNIVRELDPEGKDEALRKMVLIGHSQGGLLVKLAAVDSGSAFWDVSVLGPFEELKASEEKKEIIKRSVFFTPVPSVKRVVFISTPHRGSFVAGGWIGRLAGRFISLPFQVLDGMKELVTLNPQLRAAYSLKDIPRSTDNMDPGSDFIKKLRTLPIAPDVATHSIIPVKNPDKPKEEWNDGVVNYSSAHLDEAISELVVKSGHSTQDHPQTIEEVRRILFEHLKAANFPTARSKEHEE